MTDDVTKVLHASDCSVHNEPAYPAGPCDCGALDREEPQREQDGVDGIGGWS